jgi:hypothetical protein
VHVFGWASLKDLGSMELTAQLRAVPVGNPFGAAESGPVSIDNRRLRLLAVRRTEGAATVVSGAAGPAEDSLVAAMFVVNVVSGGGRNDDDPALDRISKVVIGEQTAFAATPSSELAIGRRGASAVRFDVGGGHPFLRRVAFLGGYDQDGAALGSVEVYDYESDVFDPPAPIPLLEPRTGHVAVPLPYGQIVIFGGDGKPGISETSAEVIDAQSGTVTVAPTVGTPLAARFRFTGTRVAGCDSPSDASSGVVGMVLLVGGSYSEPRAEIYDGPTQQFEFTGPLQVNRQDHTATLLPDGRVVVVGGTDSTGGLVAEAEIWDPCTGTFVVCGTLGTPRTGHTATALFDGRVLVAGGRGGPTNAVLATTEILDPSTCMFSAGPLLQEPRAEHFAATLFDGRIFLIDGEGERDQSLDSGEYLCPDSGDGCGQVVAY